MSKRLRDSAERHFKKALSLMQEGKNKEALKELEKAEEASLKAKAYDLLLSDPDYKGTSNADLRCIRRSSQDPYPFLKSY